MNWRSFSFVLLLHVSVEGKVLQLHNTVRKTYDVTAMYEAVMQEVAALRGDVADLRAEVKAARKQGGDALELLRQWDRVIKEEEEGEDPGNALSSSGSPFTRPRPAHSPAHSPVRRLAPCPASFTLWRKRSCYALGGERVTWMDARAACQAEHPHAQLVAVESEGEQRYLLQQLQQEKGGVRHCDVWTSGTDRDTEGRWRWESSGKPLKYTYWHRTEPNNGGSGGENCLWMDWYFNWKWNDAHCEKAKACYICELRREKIQD